MASLKLIFVAKYYSTLFKIQDLRPKIVTTDFVLAMSEDNIKQKNHDEIFRFLEYL